MKRNIAVLIAALSLFGSSRVFAQSGSAGPGALEITLIPAGGTFFVEKGRSPGFGNYDAGGSLTYNINRIVGVEGQAGGSLGISQNLAFAGSSSDVKSPNLVTYSGNVIVSVPTKSSVIPYVTGGVGGLTVLKTTGLGINDVTTFVTGNVGGGIKWYASNRWGLRVDYRFIAVQSKDTAPAFFGQESRYGHRIYAGVIINAGR